MKIAVTGANGLVGKALCESLRSSGHEPVPVVRREPRSGEIGWKPDAGEIDAEKLSEVDAVIHLGGENIAEGRWNAAKKERIRSSRVDSTQLLCETLAALPSGPRTLLCASAIGYYNDRQDEILTEESTPGDGFLPEVCAAWEDATSSAKDAGIRVVNLRIGVVLSADGAALAKMLTPFKMGVGGKVGSGKQYWSWVSIDDVVGAIEHCLADESLSGPVNVVSPTPVTNLEFTKTLGKVLGRPTIFPMPAFAAKLALGEMAQDLLLASTRVIPKQLENSGYPFRHATLEAALRELLNRPA